ncbi:cysteine desulfurase [bacterium]|nr:cysteine desulfurase [bacterium]
MSLYFNNAFSKRPLEDVIQSMLPFITQEYENPLTESEGAERARAALELTRQQIADLINSKSSEIFFVSSGTEANNWALKGLAQAWSGKKDHIVISAIEHFSIYQTAQFLNRHGCKVTVVPVNSQGMMSADDVANAILPSTFAVSIQSASDEIGVIQNIAALSNLKKRFPEVIFHTDAIQFICYEDLDLQIMPFDLVSISSNAIYGPPGVAVLFVREGTRIVPLIHGGMQEGGMRAGLQSIASIVGFGKAAEINKQLKPKWKQQLSGIQQQFFRCFDDLQIPISGSRSSRLCDNVHVLVDVDGEALLSLLLAESIRASTGSTCYEYAQKESHVLKAMEIDADAARGAILFTPGIDVSTEEVDRVCGILSANVKHLRKLKPA